MQSSITIKSALLAIAAVAVLCGRGPAWGRERLEQTLTSPGGAGTLGRVRLQMRSDSDGRLVLVARGLAPDQTYEVIANSVKVGTLRASGGGTGAVRFRTRPRGRDLMLGFDPRGALITLRAADGTDVLLGTLPTGSGRSPDKVACCLPDDGGQECEDRTADQCAAAGGVVAAAASCLPNPCDGAPPVSTEVLCCTPDDSGPECEDRTPAQCAARGGTVISGTRCAPDSCQAVPPADPQIQCCVPDDRGAECEDRTAAQCAAQGGVDMGPGTCSPDPCTGATPAGTPRADDHGGRGRGGHGGGEAGDDNGNGSKTYYGAVAAALRATTRSTPTPTARVDDRGRGGAGDPSGDDRGGRGRGTDDRGGHR
ncbi:hypothetical protein KF840_19545 [bacterium]|nr:hypothetical protein [bacterium]